MMKFKQYLLETQANGNYVCIKAESQHNFFKKIDIEPPSTGEPPPNKDYHVTLMYSKNSSVDPSIILNNLKASGFNKIYMAKVKEFGCFDSLPEDGKRDSAKSCLVMKLDCPELHMMHDYLKSFGLEHSYPEFSPHITLYYNMSVEEAHKYRDMLNMLELNTPVLLSKIDSETINQNYV